MGKELTDKSSRRIARDAVRVRQLVATLEHVANTNGKPDVDRRLDVAGALADFNRGWFTSERSRRTRRRPSRFRARHGWSEPESNPTVLLEVAGEARAIRKAIAMHDEAARAKGLRATAGAK